MPTPSCLKTTMSLKKRRKRERYVHGAVRGHLLIFSATSCWLPPNLIESQECNRSEKCLALQSQLVEKELVDELRQQLTAAEEALAAKQSKIDDMKQDIFQKEKELETISVFQAQVREQRFSREWLLKALDSNLPLMNVCSTQKSALNYRIKMINKLVPEGLFWLLLKGKNNLNNNHLYSVIKSIFLSQSLAVLNF